MTDTDRVAFYKFLTLAAEIYKEEITTTRLELYFEVLKDFELSQISEALKQHFKVGSFYPKPADLTKLIKKKPQMFKALQEPTIENERLDKLLKPLYEKMGRR